MLPLLILCLQQPGPIPDEVRAGFDLTYFYEQWLSVGGLPVVASERVHEEALLEAAFLIGQMTQKRPELLPAMAANKVRFAIMAHDEWTTDLPEHADLTPAAYWDMRARGLGATPARPAVSCGEENLLAFPGDPYSTENILIHEFAHALHEMGLSSLDPTFDGRLREVYRAAMEQGLWQDTYAASNVHEYWAEGVQSFFDTNRENDSDHGPVNTRAELLLHDPALFSLCVEVFGADCPPYVPVFSRFATQHLSHWTGQAAPTFAWSSRVRAASRRHADEESAFTRAKGESSLDFDRRAADGGGHEALLRLALRLRDGRGLPQDDEQALALFERAAATDDPVALDHLAFMLETGRGAPADRTRAFTLYRRAAEHLPQARYNLARLYETGTALPAKDLLLAAFWYELAAHSRHGPAREALTRLELALTAEDRARAKRLARAFH